MQVHPLIHLGDNLRWSLAIHYTIEYTDTAFVFAVCHVNMRRVMVAPIEADNDSKELTYFRHNVLLFDLWMQSYDKKIRKKNKVWF